MKKVFILLILLFSLHSYGIVLKQVNLPENWKIEKIEKQDNYTLGNISIPAYARQEIVTPEGKLNVHYYLCKTEETAQKVFSFFFQEKQAVYQEKTVIYRVEGNTLDVKNTLRFLKMPPPQQIKIIFPDIQDISGIALESEELLSAEEVEATQRKFGIQVQRGLQQIYRFENSRARLKVRYFYCKSSQEAQVGFKNARVQNFDDLVSYLFAQEFLAELEWIK